MATRARGGERAGGYGRRRRRGGGNCRSGDGSGSLLAFGLNYYGGLGNATTNGTLNPNPTPALVTLPGQIGTVTQIAAGGNHSLTVTSSGQLYAFGFNSYGQLGNATNNGTFNANPTPVPVTLPGQIGTVTQTASGANYSLTVTSSGQLYAFGLNYHGQLGNATGNNTTAANPTPTLVGLPGQIGTVTQSAGGTNHSLAITSSGQLYAFGHNHSGQLGNATNSGTDTPNPAPALVCAAGSERPGHADRSRRQSQPDGDLQRPALRLRPQQLRSALHGLNPRELPKPHPLLQPESDPGSLIALPASPARRHCEHRESSITSSGE